MDKIRILWADDEIDLLKPHVLFLEKKGYEVETSTNGADAYDMWVENHDDIVFFKSRAVLKICKKLQFPFNQLYFLTIFPAFLLDFCYDFIAKRRLKLTPKKQCCNG